MSKGSDFAVFTLLVLGVVNHAESKDWPAISTKFQELRGTIDSTMSQIIMIAYKDNPMVGKKIASKLDAAKARGTTAVEEANAAIMNKSLTEEKANDLIGILRHRVTTAIVNISGDLNELSPSAESNIQSICKNATSVLQDKAIEILVLLYQ